MTDKLKELVEFLKAGHNTQYNCDKAADAILALIADLENERRKVTELVDGYEKDQAEIARLNALVMETATQYNKALQDTQADVERLTLEKKAAAMNYEAVIEGLKAEVERLKAQEPKVIVRSEYPASYCPACESIYLASGPSGDTLYDFKADQWWLPELDAAVANGTHDQKRAVAVVRNLLATLENQPNATEFRKLLNKFAHACRYGDFEDRIEAGMAIEAAHGIASGAAQKATLIDHVNFMNEVLKDE